MRIVLLTKHKVVAVHHAQHLFRHVNALVVQLFLPYLPFHVKVANHVQIYAFVHMKPAHQIIPRLVVEMIVSMPLRRALARAAQVNLQHWL